MIVRGQGALAAHRIKFRKEAVLDVSEGGRSIGEAVIGWSRVNSIV